MRPLWKLLGWTVVVALSALYLVLLATDPRGLPALREKQQRISELQRFKAGLVRQREERRERVRLLREDQEELELKLRKRFRLRKPGTVDLFYPDSEATGPGKP